MILIIALSLALLVVISGMFLLAKTKKQSLGAFFKFVSYATITIGTLLVLGTLIGGMMRSHHRNGSHHGMEFRSHQEFGGEDPYHGWKKRDGKGYYKKKWGKKSKCCRSFECDHGGKTEKRKIIKKTITKGDDGEEQVNIEVIVDSE